MKKKRNLFLHVGFGRTGTTTIQKVIRSSISNNKIIYNPKAIVKTINKMITLRNDEREYRTLFEKLVRDFSRLDENTDIIISMESILRWSIEGPKSDVPFIKSLIFNLKNLFYLNLIISHREPSKLTLSNYFHRFSRSVNYEELNSLCSNINEEFIRDYYSSIKSLKDNGATNVNFIYTSSINDLEWLNYFNINLSHLRLKKMKFFLKKYNSTPSINQLLFASLISKKISFLRKIVFNLVENTFLLRLFLILQHYTFAIFMILLELITKVKIFIPLIRKSIEIFKFNLKELKQNFNFKKDKILTSHKAADKAYYRFFR